jgi:hypothetical protein
MKVRRLTYRRVGNQLQNSYRKVEAVKLTDNAERQNFIFSETIHGLAGCYRVVTLKFASIDKPLFHQLYLVFSIKNFRTMETPTKDGF